MRRPSADRPKIRFLRVFRPIAFALGACAFGLAACAGSPEAPPEGGPAVAATPAFDPAAISEAVKLDALDRVTALVNELNEIIRAKDYDAWREKLDQTYVDYFSSPIILAELSKSSLLKRQGIVLLDLRDYFIWVVYPSRQFDRVDDVEFVAADRVRAITLTPKGERLVLYDLAKSDDTWKISIGRQP